MIDLAIAAPGYEAREARARPISPPTRPSAAALDQEDQSDVARPRSQRLQDADLVGSLEHTHDHRVCESQRGDQQRHAGHEGRGERDHEHVQPNCIDEFGQRVGRETHALHLFRDSLDMRFLIHGQLHLVEALLDASRGAKEQRKGPPTPHELFPWEYAMKRKPPPASLLDARGVVSAALCVATGLSCNGDSLDQFTYATSMDASSS